MDTYREKIEMEREIDPEIRKAKALIKSIMINLDGFYPSETLCEEAFREKQYLRSKIMDCLNNIAKYIIESKE